MEVKYVFKVCPSIWKEGHVPSPSVENDFYRYVNTSALHFLQIHNVQPTPHLSDCVVSGIYGPLYA